jgi:CTP synthase
LDGVLVAPGFGPRGIEGKIIAIGYAREKNIPFLGICLGMQCAVIEFGRNVLGLKEANSTEFDKTTPDPVIDMMEMQKKIAGLGGTMRLGAFPCRLKKGSKAYDVYKVENIFERHRHRYELNNAYVEQYQKAGLIPVGINEKDNLVEIVELKGHPWFIGVQFHPEFKSTVANPHPLFVAFVKAAIEYNSKQKKHKKSS